MAVVGKTITIDFDNPRQASLRTWLGNLPPEMRKLPPLTIAVSVNVDLDAFSDDEIVEGYEEHFETEAPWAERLYRLIATGETDEALDLLYREAPEGLAPPSTEKRIAALLTGQKVSIHAEN